MNIKFLFLCVLCVSVVNLLTGCVTVTPTAATVTVAPTAAATLAPSSTPRPTETVVPSATATLTPAPPTATSTITLTPTATPDTRLDPADWKEWPVIPRVTGRGLEIYLAGLAKGNDPHAFSKVADCQGIKEVLLGAYDQPGLYTLSAGNGGLQATIDWFKGSFNRNGMAVMGGYNARAVLQPQMSDPAACQPGETPIQCEYRVHRPSIVLISLEFGYDRRTTENYTQYMRTILDFFIGKGVLPILATKADNAEGDESLNRATAGLAYDYDLPLWNWWRAAQDLPNHGMDATRPDGFHISVEAWRVRSATALQTIDAVWKGVKDAAAQIGSSAAAPAAPASTATAAAGSTVGAAPALDPQASKLIASGHALLGLVRRSGADYDYLGVYALDPQKPQMQPVLRAGWRLQAVAPDGKSMLVNQGTNLWQVYLDGSEPRLLTNQLYVGIQTTAVFVKDDAWPVAFISTESGVPAVYAASAGGEFASQRRISPDASLPFELYPSQDSGLYWLDIVCQASACLPGKVESASASDSSAVSVLPGVLRPVVASDGDSLAYTYLNEVDRTVLAVTTLERAKVWSPLPDGYAVDYNWSSSGRWLAALSLSRSDYSGKPGTLKAFLLNPSTLQQIELGLISGLNARLSWSADGRFVLVASTLNLNVLNSDMDKGYRLALYLVNAGSQQVSLLDGTISPAGKDYVFATSLGWIP